MIVEDRMYTMHVGREMLKAAKAVTPSGPK